jgi:predicted ATPase
MMLTQIQLKNFKCFKNMTAVPLTGINLFTGINGRGKSTVLQALLLMRQSVETSRETNQLTFNSKSIELGNFNDVKNISTSKTEPIEFIYTFSKGNNHVELHYRFKANEEDDLAASIDSVSIKGKYKNKDFQCSISREKEEYILAYEKERCPIHWQNLIFSERDCKEKFLEFIRDVVEFEKIHYVSANRIGPQDFYPRQSTFEFPTVGARGEFTANILSLSKRKQQTVSESLAAAPDASHAVLEQTEAWLQKIFDGGRIDIKPLEANIVVMQMNSENSANMFKPLNIGFGYSYALPIIVSGLIAREGEILIVENPEAHLHPYAQSQIAKFLAQVSRNGVQVFVESHSDHILNGLRVAVMDKIITVDDLNILYFQRNADLDIVKIPIESDGAITHWPPGFFDQTDKDFERLFGV